MSRNIRGIIAASLALVVFAPAAQPQGLGGYYANMYLQTHMAMNMLNRFGSGGGGGRRTRRVRRVVAASPVYVTSPSHSVVIARLVAAVPAANRSEARSHFVQLMKAYPALMSAAGKSVGFALRPNDLRDATTVGCVLAYQELTGKELTNTQFAAERKATYRSFAAHRLTRAQAQESGEIAEMAICLMADLKAYETSSQNKNPAETRQQMRQLALDTFRSGYHSVEYTKFAPTSRGIVKVSN